MPRKLHNALTPFQVKTAGTGRHADGGGLYLRVQAGGARSWLFRAAAGGKARDIGLGSAIGPNAISLAKAREIARAMAAQASDGALPEGKRTKARRLAAQVKALEAETRTFKEVAGTFLDLREGSWRNDKHKAQWRSTLATYAYPMLGDIPVSRIETEASRVFRRLLFVRRSCDERYKEQVFA